MDTLRRAGQAIPKPDSGPLNPDFLALNPENLPLNPAPTGQPSEAGDGFSCGAVRRLERFVVFPLLPAFSIAIPNLAGLVRNEALGTASLAATYAYFLLTAVFIWRGNRYLLDRRHDSQAWLLRPIAQLRASLTEHSAFTLTASALLLGVWLALAGDAGSGWLPLLMATGLITFFVLLIVHLYATVLGWGSWRHDFVRRQNLEVTLNQYVILTQPAHAAQASQPSQPTLPAGPKARRTLIALRGLDTFPLDVASIAFLSTQEKQTLAITREGGQFRLEEPLSELQRQLRPEDFFRANRQYLIAHWAVERFRPAPKGRLAVYLHGQSAQTEPILVSQENAAAFRAWLQGGLAELCEIRRTTAQ